eukprot:TRINITY_DN41_c0_g1_i4.p1 TRINITY_DN41_c0_g1~~TRINITY_DN41_c0_g1_i4.p1  ORF type:complete len:183 (+),score=30.85 TRINITY_DN41_c0_g1_i4:103-651(+)
MCIRDRYQRRVRGSPPRHMATNMAVTAPPPAQWKIGLCDCCEPGAAHCFINYFCCGGCNFGRAAEKALSANCLLHSFPCYPITPQGCACLCHCPDRAAIAKLQGIEEGCCTSFCLSQLCPLCSMAQVIHEVEIMKNERAGFCGAWTKNHCHEHHCHDDKSMQAPQQAQVQQARPSNNFGGQA